MPPYCVELCPLAHAQLVLAVARSEIRFRPLVPLLTRYVPPKHTHPCALHTFASWHTHAFDLFLALKMYEYLTQSLESQIPQILNPHTIFLLTLSHTFRHPLTHTPSYSQSHLLYTISTPFTPCLQPHFLRQLTPLTHAGRLTQLHSRMLWWTGSGGAAVRRAEG